MPACANGNVLPSTAPLTQAEQLTDNFVVLGFHHVEILCTDAASSAGRFAAALGCFEVAKSDMSTGNHTYASRVMVSGTCRFVFTAPYGARPAESDMPSDGAAAEAALPSPHLTARDMLAFVETHGMSVYAVGLHVADAARAFSLAVAKGATAKAPPRTSAAGDCTTAEVQLYPGSDCALRLISGTGIENGSLAFLPGYTRVGPSDELPPTTFGIARVDHIVGNVPVMLAAHRYLQSITGFHEFAEFTAEDVGTVDSGLNSVVLASDNEAVLLPINEPTTGGKRKSQIQTYLDQHHGPGVQHVALKTADIIATVRAMRGARGGFELMDRPRDLYYASLPQRLGPDALSEAQLAECAELGILADRDEEGVLLQIFTKPIGDRATLFLEIIQRVGCDCDPVTKAKVEQRPGCGGFGKGNFKELFRSIEEHETKIGINTL